MPLSRIDTIKNLPTPNTVPPYYNDNLNTSKHNNITITELQVIYNNNFKLSNSN